MNIIDRLRRRAAQFASNPAVIQGGRRWTHDELYGRVDRLSQALLGLGISKAKVVMAWLPNAHEAIESELACLQIGAIWVSLNTRLTWAEVRGVIAATEPKVQIVG